MASFMHIFCTKRCLDFLFPPFFKYMLYFNINILKVIIRFIIPVVFIIKLDWSVCTCLTQLYYGRYMYRIYYIENNYMFRHFTWPSSGWEIKKLSEQLYSTYMGCIQWGGKRWSGYEISHVLRRMGGVGTWVLLLYAMTRLI